MGYTRNPGFFVWLNTNLPLNKLKSMKIFDMLGLILGAKTSKFILIAQVAISTIVAVNIMTKDTGAQTLEVSAALPRAEAKELALVDDNSLVAISNPIAPVKIASLASKISVEKSLPMTITAYSSSPEETDSTPLITASGKMVSDGIVANNLLPFGTKVRIPEIYGEKVLTVQDRMHYRMGDYKLDIWFPEKSQAKQFGVKKATIEVLED
jgi:3D (Asp-Asp-Asp) domain-containing protein